MRESSWRSQLPETRSRALRTSLRSGDLPADVTFGGPARFDLTRRVKAGQAKGASSTKPVPFHSIAVSFLAAQ